MATTTHQKIINLLNENSVVDFKDLHHEPTPTSEDSARVRGVDLSTGGKALMLSIDDQPNLSLFVISASKKLHTKAIKRQLKVKNVRFATKEELSECTGGLVPGEVPPFGNIIFPDVNLYIDTSITENEMIAFNAGSLTDSIIMKVEDYLKIASPVQIFTFSK